MAKDLPEYQKRSTITPAANVVQSDFAGAAVQATSGLDVIGQLGLQVAKQASKEQGRIAGYEAGFQPGRTLLPAFTPSDAEFVDAYKNQEYSIAMRNGNRALTDLLHTTLKNPTRENLENYKQLYSENIEELAGTLTKDNGIRVKEALIDKALSGQYQIEDQILRRDKQYLKENFKQYYTSSLESLANAIAVGNDKEAQNIIDNTVRIMHESSGSLELSPGAIEERKNLMMEAAQVAHDTRTMNQAIGKGNAEQLLKEQAQKPATVENARRLDAYSSTYRNYQAATAARDDLLMTKAESKLALNALTTEDMLDLKEELTPNRYADMELKVAKHMASQKQEGLLMDYYLTNKNNAVALANLSSADLNKAFNNEIKMREEQRGSPLDFEQQAEIAATVKAPITSFQKRLETGIKDGDLNQFIAAAKAVDFLSKANATALNGFDKDARATARKFNNFKLNTGRTDEQAAEMARNEVYNLKPEVRELRQIEAQQWLNEKHGSEGSYATNNQLMKKKIVEVMGGTRWFGKNTVVPDEMIGQFRDLMPDYYERTGDRTEALNQLAEDMKAIYPETKTNHRNEFMKNAPEKVAPDMDVGFYLQNSKAYALHLFIEENKRLHADKSAFVIDKIEWPDDPFVGKDILDIDMIKGEIVSGNPNIIVNGKKVNAVIKSDDLTMQSVAKVPSWAFYSTSGGIEVPLSSPTTFGGVGRWYMDSYLFKQQTQKYADKLWQDAIKSREQAAELSPEVMDSDAYWLLQREKQKQLEESVGDQNEG